MPPGLARAAQQQDGTVTDEDDDVQGGSLNGFVRISKSRGLGLPIAQLPRPQTVGLIGGCSLMLIEHSELSQNARFLT